MTNLYTVINPDGSFLMTAPMVVIEMVFKLHRPTVMRIERELNAGNTTATVHFNGRETALGHLLYIKICEAE